MVYVGGKVWYGTVIVTLRYGTLDDFIILRSRPRKPIPAGDGCSNLKLRVHLAHAQLALTLALTGDRVPSTLSTIMIMLFIQITHLRDNNQGSVNICSDTSRRIDSGVGVLCDPVYG